MVIQLSRAGTHHQEQGEENQDAVCSGSAKGICVISLADGVSACGEARCGAEIASRAITDLLLKKSGYFLTFDQDKIARFALDHILWELSRRAKEEQKAVEDYSSTVTSVLVDRKSRKMLCFNLGDSMVLAVGNGVCRVAAMPSDSREGCCVTTTKHAASLASVRLLDSGGVESVILCSDGAWRQMFDKNRLKPEVASLLTHHEYQRLKEFLTGQDCFDDYSFIALDLRQRKGRRTA